MRGSCTGTQSSYNRGCRCPVCSESHKKHAYRYAQYGLTGDEYASLVERHDGRCGICREPETTMGNNGKIRSLAIDHDHVTGTVRGLLCHRCNMGLGYFSDDAEKLHLAIEYLSMIR